MTFTAHEEQTAQAPARRPPMQVQDLMTRRLVTAGREMPILAARALMSNEGIRHLLVTDGQRLAGIVTDRDIRLHLPSPATSLSVWEANHLLARLTVGEVMTQPVTVVAPDTDAREATITMLERKIGGLPVLDGLTLVGILTETDLLRAFAISAAMAEGA